MMTMDLTGLWRFQPDPLEAGGERAYAGPAYDDHRWREVRVPVDFDTCHPALETYEGTGWFRRRVRVPNAWRGKRVVLRFEGVNDRARVWVNGTEVGGGEDPFLPLELDVGAALTLGDDNLIAVRVDNRRRPGAVPGRQRGWRNVGGILREVRLIATDPCYVSRVVPVARPVEDGGQLDLQVFVRNARQSGADVALTLTVHDAAGQDVAQLRHAARMVPPGEEVPFGLSGVVAGAEPWSPDAPRLYTVKVALHVDGAPVGETVVRTGFRTIEVRDHRLWLNGEPLYLTGFNRHEDSPDRNMCPDPELVRRDLTAMKEAGANFVRLCHYPHHPAELDLCDELGLLVMGEIPLYWWEGLAEGAEMATRKLGAAKRQLRAMIRRDCAHPAVIFWSVSNETKEERPEVAEGNVELVELAKGLDPTRLAVHVSDHWQRHPNFEADDVICVNGYPSFNAERFGDGGDLDAATAFWREGLAALHDRYPDKPVLVTEFGHISFHDVVDSEVSGEHHAAVLEHELAGMDAPYVCGAAIWCWADHAWPPATFDYCFNLAVSPYGVVTRDRRKKVPYRTAQRLFRERQGIPEPVAPEGPPGPGPTGYPVMMIRPNLDDLPEVPFPEGFRARPMGPEEAGLWADIWRDADASTKLGVDLFRNQFGDDMPATRWRTFFVVDEHGVAVATISSWYNRTYEGEDYGQIHWVAVRRRYWGRGLGKAMLAHALKQMAQWHDRAFLGTQTKRLAAIKIYLDFGFVPDMRYPGAERAWREVRANLDHPALRAMGEG
jgi:beta-glucuronidase